MVRAVIGPHEFVIKAVDLARVGGRDILLMQGSELLPGGLAVESVLDRP